jgi:hypothetical protein
MDICICGCAIAELEPTAHRRQKLYSYLYIIHFFFPKNDEIVCEPLAAFALATALEASRDCSAFCLVLNCSS